MSPDHLDIQDLIARYAHAVDRRDWDALDLLFTGDCHIDYTAMGGIAGDLASVKTYLAETMPMFVSTQHMMGLPVVELDGDEASAVTICHNPLVLADGDDPPVLICALWYHHRFVRTAQGWRISDLREERCYMKSLKGKGN